MRTVLAVALLLEIILAGVLVVKIWPTDEPAALAPEDPALVVFQDGEPVDLDFVSGLIQIRMENPTDATHLELRYSSGGGKVLSPKNEADLDTRTLDNGPYTLHAIRANATVASLDVTIQNARQDLSTTAAVVGTTTALAAGGSAVGSTLGSRAAMAAAQIGKESLMAVGEDHLALRSGGRGKRLASWLALALTLVLVMVFFAFEGLSSYAWGPYSEALPVAGGVSMLFVAAALGVEALLGFASRATTTVRFLGSGAISLVASAVIFRTPFGYPGYVEEIRDEDDDGTDDEPPHVEGIRAIASMTVFLALLLPFLWVGYRWNYAVVDQAMEVALVGLATSALPIRPLPGHDIWKWRRSVAVAYAVGAYFLYFGFVLAFLPMTTLLPLGAIGATVYLATFMWLRARSADTAPAWYVWSLEQAEALRLGAGAFTPRPIRRLAAGLNRAANGMGSLVDRVVNGLSWVARHIVVPITAVAGAMQQRRFEKARARAMAQYARDLAAIMDQLVGLDDDDVFAIIGSDGEADSHRVGDLRDDAYRTGLLQSLGSNPPAIVTVVDGDEARTVYLSNPV